MGCDDRHDYEPSAAEIEKEKSERAFRQRVDANRSTADKIVAKFLKFGLKSIRSEFEVHKKLLTRLSAIGRRREQIRRHMKKLEAEEKELSEQQIELGSRCIHLTADGAGSFEDIWPYSACKYCGIVS